MVLMTDTPKTSPNEPDSTCFVTASTSLVVLLAVVAAIHRSPETGITHVSRKSPNSRGRKRTAQGPRGIQARDRREICAAILHHKSGRRNWPDISLRGMGTDRTEAGFSFDLQSHQEVRNMEALDKEIQEPFTDDDTKTLDDLGI